jgi:hypothetical protein
MYVLVYAKPSDFALDTGRTISIAAGARRGNRSSKTAVRVIVLIT